MRMLSCIVAFVGLATPVCPAVDRGAEEATARLRGFLEKLKRHDVELYEPIEHGTPAADDGEFETGTRFYRNDRIVELDALLKSVAEGGGSDGLLLLLQAATFRPESDPVLERRRWRAEQPWIVRRLASEALVGCTDPDTDEWLVRNALTDRSPRVGVARRELGARVLAQRRSIPSAGSIARLLGDDAPRVRAAAARSLGELGVTVHADDLVASSRDPDPHVRLECILALGSLADSDPVGVLRERLRVSARAALEDPHWSVRAAAATLVALTRDPKGVESLVLALSREQPEIPGSRHRVRTTIRNSLASLTGQDFASTRPEDWSAWWNSAAGTFRPATEPISPAIEQGARFAGIPIESDQVLFLLDASGSMRQPKPDDRSGPDRWQIAVRELERCLRALRPGTRFNVVLFAEEARAFAATTATIDDATIARTMEFVRATEPSRGTDLIAALELAFAAESRGAFGRPPAFEPDTIVLLSDGVPSRGAVLVPEQILYEINEANRSRRVVFHTIDASGGRSALLAAIAAANQGEVSSL